MKKADISNIVNEEVSKIRTIVEEEVKMYKSVNEDIFQFPKSFEIKKTIDYDAPGVPMKKLFRGTYKQVKDGTYYNDTMKSEVTLEEDDFTNFDRMGDQDGFGSGGYGITVNEAAAPKFTAKEFVEYVNDEFDSETLQLMQNVLAERMKFLDKMKDMANPRTVVQGYMRKDDLKENLGRYDVKLEEGAFSELQILADESSNFEEFYAKVKQEFPKVNDEKMRIMLRSLYDDEYFKMAEEITKNPLDSGVFDTICEVAQMNGFDKKIDNKFRTSTALVLHISKQLSEEKRRDFMRDVRDVKNAFNIEEFVL